MIRIMAGMAGRYATALFELAKEQKQLEQVERDVASVQALLEGSPDLARLVRSPVISAGAQARAGRHSCQGRHFRVYG